MQLSSARNKICIFGVVFFSGFLILILRLAYVHLLSEGPGNRYEFSMCEYARRGAIYDRNGKANPLADDLPVRRLILDRDMCGTNLPAVVSGLSRLLGCSAAFLHKRIPDPEKRKRCHYVDLGIIDDPDVVREISTNRLYRSPRILLQREFERNYIGGNSASQVLGFTSKNNLNGVCGIEREFNAYLVGTNGFVKGYHDARQNELRERRTAHTPAVNGCDIELTIDQTIQQVTEHALDNVLAKYGAPRAWAVVMRCATGEILAMSTRPSPDPNGRKKNYNPEDWRNCPVSYVYDPGSTMKALTVSAALNENTITTDMSFDCEYGAWSYCGKILHDSHSYGILTVPFVLKKSSNIGTAKIALTLGDERLYDYMRKAGFSSYTGIELPDENPGRLNRVKNWSKIDITRIAIGHSITVSALQMVTFYCAIANGGRLMKPSLIRRISRPDGSTVREFRAVPSGPPVFRPEVTTMMRTMLEGVTASNGTGRRAIIPGYPVAGKTGTAQMLVPVLDVDGNKTGGLRYATDENIASFCGFLPADRPEIAIIVVVERTTKGMGGGLVAAPVFAEIGMQTARYLDIPSESRIVEALPVWEDSRAALELLEETAP